MSASFLLEMIRDKGKRNNTDAHYNRAQQFVQTRITSVGIFVRKCTEKDYYYYCSKCFPNHMNIIPSLKHYAKCIQISACNMCSIVLQYELRISKIPFYFLDFNYSQNYDFSDS